MLLAEAKFFRFSSTRFRSAVPSPAARRLSRNSLKSPFTCVVEEGVWPDGSCAQALVNSSSLLLSRGPAALHKGCLLAHFQNTLNTGELLL